MLSKAGLFVGLIDPPQTHRHTYCIRWRPAAIDRPVHTIQNKTSRSSSQKTTAAHSIVHRVSMSSASSSSRSAIFPSWHFASWTAVDDRVRGGSSRSHLDPVEVEVKGKSTKAARFWGTLGKHGDFLTHLYMPTPDAG
jgi:hypothetical protein